MTSRPLLAACAALLLAAPVAAARPVKARPSRPERQTVTVHHGLIADAAPPFAAVGAPWPGDAGGYPPIGYWEANYGREDDAAIFAQRYGCVRPIWNAKSNRYMSACN